MTLGAIRGALFDMDGLLLDSERQFMAALVEVAADVGVTQTAAEAFFATLVGTSNTETTARLQTFLPPDVDVRTFDQNWRAGSRPRLKVAAGMLAQWL